MNNYEYGKTLDVDKREELYTDIADGELCTYETLYSDFADWLMQEYKPTIHLTPEERKAARLAVAMGTPYIRLFGKAVGICEAKDGFYFLISHVPALKVLDVDEEGYVAEWIAETPIDLREVLKNDT